MSTGKTQRLLITRISFLAAMFLLLALLSACDSAYATISPPALASRLFFLSGAWTNRPFGSRIDPASKDCSRVGGTVVMRTRGDGRTYRLCQFPDNRACEVWALFRGDCPVGGVRIIGLNTIAQYYCAWLGGETLAVPHATCTFPNGKICDDDALYRGMCSAENAPEAIDG